jgi:hypothetical protein
MSTITSSNVRNVWYTDQQITVDTMRKLEAGMQISEASGDVSVSSSLGILTGKHGCGKDVMMASHLYTCPGPPFTRTFSDVRGLVRRTMLSSGFVDLNTNLVITPGVCITDWVNVLCRAGFSRESFRVFDSSSCSCVCVFHARDIFRDLERKLRRGRHVSGRVHRIYTNIPGRTGSCEYVCRRRFLLFLAIDDPRSRTHTRTRGASRELQ